MDEDGEYSQFDGCRRACLVPSGRPRHTCGWNANGLTVFAMKGHYADAPKD